MTGHADRAVGDLPDMARRWQALVRIENSWRRRTDPLLAPLESTPVNGTLANDYVLDPGRQWAYRVEYVHLQPEEFRATWEPLKYRRFVPLLGNSDRGVALARLLDAWADEDGGVVGTLSLPSRDAQVIAPLVSRRWLPINVLAVLTKFNRSSRADGTVAQIEPVADADSVAVASMWMRLIASEQLYGAVVRRAGTEAGVREAVRASNSGGSTACVKAFCGEQIVGFGKISFGEAARWLASKSRVTRPAYIDSVWVDEGWRGRGIGGALFRALERRARHEGSGGLLLHHSPLNSLATPFWYSRGFRPLLHTWRNTLADG